MITMTQQVLRFVVSFPQARDVFALGDFNNWSTVATPLAETGPGQWELHLPTSLDPRQLAFFVWDYGASFGRFVFNSEPAVG